MVECPEEYYECLTEEEYDEILELFVENDIAVPEAMGDAEAAANFVWEVLFLTPIELIYIGITMTVLATYGLSIYYMFKKIQKKFS
tara:strand:+ start:168 stop:425 length:258 start_codon:yes stop_codon:yes gene_type:complete